MNSKYILQLLVALPAVLILAACGVPGTAEQADHGEENQEHEGEADEHDGEEFVQIEPDELAEFGIATAPVEGGTMRTVLSLPGEVRFNEDRMVHIVPILPGVATEVKKGIGDGVGAGEVLAVISSRELAEAKSAFLAALERQSLDQVTLVREEDLWRKEIGSEQEYLDAKRALAESQINLKLARQKLLAIGLSAEQVQACCEEPEERLTRYELRAPFKGTVIEKHVVVGESVTTDSPIYLLADLSNVWVDLQVFRKDLALLSEGQEVRLRAGEGVGEAIGVVSYLGPQVGEETRTATARIVLANPDGRWRPGLFVEGLVEVGEAEVALKLPKSAVVFFHGAPHVFVEHEGGFEAVLVETGKEDSGFVEIISGLTPGQICVVEGAFTLKSELDKGSFGHGHSH